VATAVNSAPAVQDHSNRRRTYEAAGQSLRQPRCDMGRHIRRRFHETRWTSIGWGSCKYCLRLCGRCSSSAPRHGMPSVPAPARLTARRRSPLPPAQRSAGLPRGGRPSGARLPAPSAAPACWAAGLAGAPCRAKLGMSAPSPAHGIALLQPRPPAHTRAGGPQHSDASDPRCRGRSTMRPPRG
jgi:hypothetical protein